MMAAVVGPTCSGLRCTRWAAQCRGSPRGTDHAEIYTRRRQGLAQRGEFSCSRPARVRFPAVAIATAGDIGRAAGKTGASLRARPDAVFERSFFVGALVWIVLGFVPSAFRESGLALMLRMCGFDLGGSVMGQMLVESASTPPGDSLHRGGLHLRPSRSSRWQVHQSSLLQPDDRLGTLHLELLPHPAGRANRRSTEQRHHPSKVTIPAGESLVRSSSC